MNAAAAIREMVARGLTANQALIAIEVIEGQEKEKLEARLAHKRDVDRERQRRHRSRNVTRDRRDERDSPLARVEDNSTNQEDTGKNSTPSPKTARDILLECLKPETAEAVLAHRKALRCPLTPHTAGLLVKGFNSTADPEDAAQEMLVRGWRGFKAQWYNNRNKNNGSRKQAISDVAPGFLKRLDEQFAFLDGPQDSGPDGGPAVRTLPPQRG